MSTTSDIGTSDYVVGYLPEVRNQGVENPAWPVDAYDALVETHSHSASGYRVTQDTAMYISAVWQAVEQISGAIASTPLELFERDARGDVTRAINDPVHFAVRHQPNEEQQAVKFWARTMVHRLLWNNAYIWADREGGGLSLVHLLPDRTAPERIDGELVIATEVDGRMWLLPHSDVMHIEGIVDDQGRRGRDRVRAARDAWGVILARQGFVSRFFKRGGRVGGILELPMQTTKPRRDQIEQNFRNVHENPNESFRSVVLRDGAKFHQAQHSMQDTQLVEASRESVSDVARYFNLSPGRLGQPGSKSYGSTSEDNRDYLTTTLRPHMSSIIGEAERVLISERARRAESMFFRYNVDDLIRETRAQRYAAHQIGIQAEFLSANEARRIEGLNGRAGGDAFRNPNINPQAMIRAIADTAGNISRVVAGKHLRRKTPATDKWWEQQEADISQKIRPVVEAHASVFGGDAKQLCRRIASAIRESIVAADGTTAEEIVGEMNFPELLEGVIG